jgi:hypothetical protein
VACGCVLDRCIFCGGHPTTEEHLVADWVLRAFARSRHPHRGIAGTFVGPDSMRIEAEEPISTAQIVCQPCNNGWMAKIDNAAAQVLRPLVQQKKTAELTPEGQRAVAGWIFKSALTFDALQSGNAGPLVGSRRDFAANCSAPAGSTIYLGPAGPIPFSIDAVPAAAGLVIFGVRVTEGRMVVTSRAHSHNGMLAHAGSYTLPIPGYLVMLGRLKAVISGIRAPLVPPPGQGFVRIWPTAIDWVTVTSVLASDASDA